MTEPSAKTIYLEAKAALTSASRAEPAVASVLHILSAPQFSADHMVDITGRVPAHERLLQTAISEIPDTLFGNLKSALHAAYEKLHWRVDDGHYYEGRADVGQGYKTGNMHTLLIGPEDCPLLASDFLLGFFLLAPGTLYRDHKHLAPEIYLPLTGPSGWRFEMGEWADHDPGHPICNAPNVVHATRTYQTPFLAIFAWERDVNSMCDVIAAKDWTAIEAELAT